MANETAGKKAGYEEIAQEDQPKSQPLTEGIRAKFPRKQAASQGHLAALRGKTLSMKSLAIREREMRAAKAEARAASGGCRPSRVRSEDICSTSPAKTDTVGEKIDAEHGQAAFNEQ